MNTLARFVMVAAVLGTALFLSGCVATTTRAPRVKVVEEFAVVESSTEKELTPAQLAELRQAVLNYLRAQSMTDGRLYYVKVTFPAANPADEPQWAVVRIGSMSTRTFTVIAAYPGADDYYPYDHHYYRTGYTTGYYPGYAGFSRWGSYDPFDYNYGGYSGGGGSYHSGPPRDYTKPDKPEHKPDHPPGTRTRWDTSPRSGSDEPRRYPPRTANPERWARDQATPRNQERRSGERTDRPERASTPRPETSYSPAPERAYSSPVERSSPQPERSYTPSHSEPSSSRSESPTSGIQQTTTSEKER